jgi:hypothetical protein
VHPQVFRTAAFIHSKKVRFNSMPILSSTNDGRVKRYSARGQVM